jgi:TIR domain
MGTKEAKKRVEVFYSYHQQDEKLRHQLEKHLSILKRKNLINTWSFHVLHSGVERLKEINTHLNAADIILLLVSPDFLDSDYCYEVEVKRALERFEAGEAIVIPIILRPVDWTGTPFSHLEPLPTGGKPVTTWKNRESAFYDISLGVQYAAETVLEKLLVDYNQHRPTFPVQERQEAFVKNYLYDIVLAFALEDRSYAETLADSLRTHGVKVFCYSEGINKEMQLALWGKKLHTYLFDLHQRQWHYCVLLLSQNYAPKLAHHEREAALAHALQEHGYILPIRLDETAFPGINEDTAFPIKWHEIDLEDISELLARKVKEISRLLPDH